MIDKIKNIVLTGGNGYLKYDLFRHIFGICINNLDYFYKLRYFTMMALFNNGKNINDDR